MLSALLALGLASALSEPPAAMPPPGPPAPLTQPLHDAVTSAIRNCPVAKEGEIAICARDRGFSEKFRIQRLTKPTVDLGEPKLKISGSGGTLPGDCSNIGQAGAFGCSKRDYDDWAAWKRRQQAEAKDRP